MTVRGEPKACSSPLAHVSMPVGFAEDGGDGETCACTDHIPRLLHHRVLVHVDSVMFYPARPAAAAWRRGPRDDRVDGPPPEEHPMPWAHGFSDDDYRRFLESQSMSLSDRRPAHGRWNGGGRFCNRAAAIGGPPDASDHAVPDADVQVVLAAAGHAVPAAVGLASPAVAGLTKTDGSPSGAVATGTLCMDAVPVGDPHVNGISDGAIPEAASSPHHLTPHVAEHGHALQALDVPAAPRQEDEEDHHIALLMIDARPDVPESLESSLRLAPEITSLSTGSDMSLWRLPLDGCGPIDRSRLHAANLDAVDLLGTPAVGLGSLGLAPQAEPNPLASCFIGLGAVQALDGCASYASPQPAGGMLGNRQIMTPLHPIQDLLCRKTSSISVPLLAIPPSPPPSKPKRCCHPPTTATRRSFRLQHRKDAITGGGNVLLWMVRRIIVGNRGLAVVDPGEEEEEDALERYKLAFKKPLSEPQIQTLSALVKVATIKKGRKGRRV